MSQTSLPSPSSAVGPPSPSAAATARPALVTEGTRAGRIVVLDVEPVVDAGRWPAKAVVGEQVPITATVFREGHDACAATAVLIDPDGVEHLALMRLVTPGLAHYEAVLAPDRTGTWALRVEGWSDPFGTWEHDATIKVAAGIDSELMLAEGVLVLRRAVAVPGRHPRDVSAIEEALAALEDTSRAPTERLAQALAPAVRAALANLPLRDMVTSSPTYRLVVQRERALYSSWYEFFPRSEGAHRDETGAWVSGTLATARSALSRIAMMGFDVAYLTPVHPIGEINRKGRNNTLTAGPGDPGSPYAIGSAKGGHDAIHPDLGTFEDFDAFVEAARDHGLEVALDLALQCAPDHPWVSEHPEWFTTRADGSVAYAENPPKKYQDIYPLNFDKDPEGIYAEVLRIVLLWVEHGVTLFRVDNPHTKPVEFWEWLIAEVNRDHPDVIFLAEAFTKPPMMHTLAKAGFHQSYTYFTWRTTGPELQEYVTELAGDAASYMRPNFWPTTHDILTPQMQYGGPAMFKIRAVLAATLSPSWGIYAGYELHEHVARSGAEEQVDNEKYEFKARDFAAAEREGRSLAPYLRRLNLIRSQHKSLHRLRGTTFHRSDDENILVFSRRYRPAANQPNEREDVVIGVVNLDPHGARPTTIHLDMPALGLDWSDSFAAFDLLSGETFAWREHNYVRLDPFFEPAHLIHVRRL
jgi:starch synthase (maltosyl-transferring)